jgi:hypothetical protein
LSSNKHRGIAVEMYRPDDDTENDDARDSSGDDSNEIKGRYSIATVATYDSSRTLSQSGLIKTRSPDDSIDFEVSHTNACRRLRHFLLTEIFLLLIAMFLTTLFSNMG